MEKEQKKASGFSKLMKFIAVIGAIYAACVAIGKFVEKKAQELERKNQGEKEKNYLAFMNGKAIKLGKEEVEEITVKTYLGGVTLDLTEATLAKETEVRINSLMSGVVVKVPPMVRVVLEGTNIMGGFANMVPSYEAESLPVVYVYAESVMGGIAVQMVPDSLKKNAE